MSDCLSCDETHCVCGLEMLRENNAEAISVGFAAIFSQPRTLRPDGSGSTTHLLLHRRPSIGLLDAQYVVEVWSNDNLLMTTSPLVTDGDEGGLAALVKHMTSRASVLTSAAGSRRIEVGAGENEALGLEG